ncbi:hypothetical protein E0485_15695 [Paenibacillus albiflavus]|uniref:Uncharacterized protein n=1 Tax=Paenibacillus albiflavus TaxID=2545760 RepID=A0A4R4E9F2_9BACL|nr:hypothetical protein [Paenibacillus albiflavus]TCZ75817.1 hypothetical protein E0485_15695 [Paenibacillus albiflavus]
MNKRHNFSGIIILLVVVGAIIAGTLWFSSMNHVSSVPAPTLIPIGSETSTMFPSSPPLKPSSSPSPTPFPEVTIEEQQAFAVEVKEEPIITDWPEDTEALIRLDSEPRMIKDSLSVIVPNRDESITIFFKNRMNRVSVEQSLKKIDTSDAMQIYPKLLLHWSNDYQLHVKFRVSQEEVIPNVKDMYYFDLNGAMTYDGQMLQFHRFIGNVAEPNQWWQVAIDEPSKMKPLTSFEIPYLIQSVDRDGRYVMLSRVIDYCGCDRMTSSVYSLYDTTMGTYEDYPLEVQLTKDYRGSGSFVADHRGFFYDNEAALKSQLPTIDTAVQFQLKDYVHRASFSKDNRFIIMITGPKEPQEGKKLDLTIVELATRQITTLSQVINGRIPYPSMQESNLHPFIDDGKDVYLFVNALKPEDGEVRYRYNWNMKKLIKWEPPKTEIIPPIYQAGFVPSDDGQYRIYSGGIYEGERRIISYEGILNKPWEMWIPNSHRIVRLEGDDSEHTLRIFDVDTRVEVNYDLGTLVITGSRFVSADGKYLYTSASNLSHK